MKLILKILAAPVVAALALFIWICAGLLYCSAFLFGLAGTIVAILDHSSGDCLPYQSDGPPDGGGVAVRQDSGFTVCHSGQDIWIRQPFGA